MANDVTSTAVVRDILFVEEAFSGMVGETIHAYHAYRICWRSGQRLLVPLGLAELKVEYKKLTYKNERRLFWAWMREFTPKWQAFRLNEQAAEARSRTI